LRLALYSSKFVSVERQRKRKFIAAHYFPSPNQLKMNAPVQLEWPLNTDLNPFTRIDLILRMDENAATTYVQRAANPHDRMLSPAKCVVVDL